MLDRNRIQSVYAQLSRFNEINLTDHELIKSVLKLALVTCDCGTRLEYRREASALVNESGEVIEVDLGNRVWYECKQCGAKYSDRFVKESK